MNERIRIGVAGAGVFGGYHCTKITDHPKAALSGVYDIDALRAASLADIHSTKPCTEYGALLDAADAIVIATTASSHYDLAAEALRSGKHVFVEKPITLFAEEADALIDLAKRQKVILQAGHQERYVAEAAGLFTRQRAPLKIDCVRHTAASGRCEDVSVALDLMVHDLDLVRMLARSEIDAADAHGDMHDIRAELRLTNGSVVTLSASRRATIPERRMTLVYDDGVIEFDFVNRRTANTTPKELSSDFESDAAPLGFRDPLAFGADAFISAIMAGAAPSVSGEDARDALVWARRIESAAGIDETPVVEIAERRRA